METFNISISLFQLSTLPIFPFEVTTSPRIKSFFLSVDWNTGKSFSATILADELDASNFPGNLPEGIIPLRLKVTTPMLPPRGIFVSINVKRV